MSTGTGIGWTDATWNCITGCTRVSAGCDHCYAAKMTYRLDKMGQEKYHGLTVLNPKGDRHFNGVVRCHRDALEIPYGWKKPRQVFVNSMSDTFHGQVPFEFVAEMFTTMAQTPQHTYQVLTKRPRQLNEFYAWNYPEAAVPNAIATEDWLKSFPNVWIGTSVESQEVADQRISDLLRTPAAVRFLSVEPLLGPVNLSKAFGCRCRGFYGSKYGAPRYSIVCDLCDNHERPPIQWIIVGCESHGGKAGRFADGYPEAARDIIEMCQRARVAVFHKQMPINGRVSHEPSEWPEWARVQQFPEATR